jgi:hypothetical protein
MEIVYLDLAQLTGLIYHHGDMQIVHIIQLRKKPIFTEKLLKTPGGT